MTYFVYEKTIHKKCRIHRPDCSFCNDGRGVHGGGKTASGEWSGPYQDLAIAEAFANSRGQPDTRACGMCTGEAVKTSQRVANSINPRTVQQVAETAPWLWDEAQEFNCSLRLRWIPLGRLTLDAKGKLLFPKAEPAPGLYRLRTPSRDGRMAVYIGESDNVQRRFGNYRQGSEGQATSHRINGWLKRLLAEKCEISISAVTDTAWLVDGADTTSADLSSKSVRRLFEQWAITAEHAQDIESLNR